MKSVIVRPDDEGNVSPRETKVANDAQKIVVAHGTRKIGAEAFRGFDELRTVEIPASVQGIEKEAFAGCVTLERVVFAEGSHLAFVDEAAFADCCALAEINLPTRVHNIGRDAFRGCCGLKHFSMGPNVWEIGDGAFADIPVFRVFFDAVERGGTSAEVLSAFRALTAGVSVNYDLRAIAFSWPTASLDCLVPDQVWDWPRDDYKQLLDVFAAMPFRRVEDGASPLGHVERVLLRFLGQGGLPHEKRALLTRRLLIERPWVPWKDILNQRNGQWDAKRNWDWSSLPVVFCDNKDYRAWWHGQHPASWEALESPETDCSGNLEGTAQQMLQCAEKGEAVGFALMVGVWGREMADEVFRYCIQERNEDGLAGVIRGCAKAGVGLPLKEVALEVVTGWWNQEEAVKVLAAIEDVAPGLCASLVDAYGRNLLYCSSFKQDDTGASPFDPKNELAQVLVRWGCDPNLKNVNGLSWQDLVDADDIPRRG